MHTHTDTHASPFSHSCDSAQLQPPATHSTILKHPQPPPPIPWMPSHTVISLQCGVEAQNTQFCHNFMPYSRGLLSFVAVLIICSVCISSPVPGAHADPGGSPNFHYPSCSFGCTSIQPQLSAFNPLAFNPLALAVQGQDVLCSVHISGVTSP